jgi:hypothetical protein
LPGEKVERKRLHDMYGGRRQGGIGPSSTTPNVFLFTDPDTGPQHGYVDGWQQDGCFHYTGEGQRGDQEMKSGNRAVLRHRSDGRALRLFRGSGGSIVYEDEFVIDADQPFYTTDAPETGGGPIRSVIVFRLRSQTIAPKATSSDLKIAISPVVTEVPVEAMFTERAWVEPDREPYEAERRESQLVQRFRAYLQKQGHAPIRLQILPPGEIKPILSDLYVAETGLLVEAKGSVDRFAIRMAIGQLADYRRFVKAPRCAILVPAKPRADLVALIQHAGISLYWEDEKGFSVIVAREVEATDV